MPIGRDNATTRPLQACRFGPPDDVSTEPRGITTLLGLGSRQLGDEVSEALTRVRSLGGPSIVKAGIL